MINEDKKPVTPSEEQLLAYVEGTLTEEERTSIERCLGSDERAVRGLARLREDREALCALQDPDPPASLLDDCISVVERSVLISEGPMAPPISINRYRSAGRWRRYAAAAVFFIVVVGGGWWIAQTTMFKPHDPGFLTPEEKLARQQELQARREAESSSAEGDQFTNGTGDELTPGGGENRVSDRNRFAANMPAVADSSSSDHDESSRPSHVSTTTDLVVRSDETPFTTAPLLPDDSHLNRASIATEDPGFGVRVSAVTSRAQTMDQLRTLIAQHAGAALVYNAPPMERRLPVDDSITSNPRKANDAAASSDRNERDSNARPHALNDSNYGSGADRGSSSDDHLVDAAVQSFIAPVHQHEYREAGFDYTLVGTPSQIQTILESLNDDAQFGGRVRIRHRPGDEAASGESISLDDLVPPALPKGREWSRAILWFSDPQRNFPMAMRLHKSFEPEPIIRVPIRITGE